MSDKEREFLDYTFEQLTGSRYVGNGILWRDRYREECEIFLINVRNYLNTFEKVFGTPTIRIINQTIFSEIITVTTDINLSRLTDISTRYGTYFLGNAVYC